MSRRISVMVVDDHYLVLNSLVDLLQSADRKVYPALSAEEALQLCKVHTIDVAFIDARMRPVSGIELIAMLRKKYTSIKIVGITGFYEEPTIADFIHVGVNGILDKSRLERSAISNCLDCILGGHSYFTDNVKKVIEKIAIQQKVPSTQFNIREQEIIHFLCQGYSAKEIAGQLKISKNTVEDYKKAMLEKTNTKNSIELVSFLHKNGLV